jgi:hypothetical protein
MIVAVVVTAVAAAAAEIVPVVVVVRHARASHPQYAITSGCLLHLDMRAFLSAWRTVVRSFNYVTHDL